MVNEHNKNPREWARDTTDRQGRERDLEEYEAWLGFRREDLKDKTVLDLGSGEREFFSEDLKSNNINADVYSLNPDYSSVRYRKILNNLENWQRKSVAGIAQEMPFKDNTFNLVLGLFSVAAFSNPDSEWGNPGAGRMWSQEILRILKPGGKAILAPFMEETEYMGIKKFLEDLGASVEVEAINNAEIGSNAGLSFWKRMIISKTNGQI